MCLRRLAGVWQREDFEPALRTEDRRTERMIRTIRAYLSRAYNKTLHGRFLELKQAAGGMLEPAVYHRLYDEVRALRDLDVLEIGGGAGAGTIAIAWAMRDSGKGSKLVVVEKCEGGSRVQFGGRAENLRRLEAHLERFGAAARTVLYPHELRFENGAEVRALLGTPEIAALVHDADGRIDRDFHLFWPLVVPGGLIVVDDFDDVPEFKPPSARYPDGGTKSLLTFRLLTQFIEWGLFEPTRKVRSTMFGRKPPGGDFARLDLEACERIRAEVEAERDRHLRAKGLATAAVGPARGA